MQNEIRFVLVEDEPLILSQLKYSICACDPRFRVVGTAGNGRDGLAEIERLHPDIIITDIRMPVLSGLEMIAAAREKQLSGRYLILSGYDEFQYARSALQLGVDDYLLKPIDPDALAEKLRALVQTLFDEQSDRLAQYLRSWFLLDLRPEEQDDLPDDAVCYFLFAQAGAAASRANVELSPGGQFWRENDFAWLSEIETRWAVHIDHFSGKYVNEHVFAIVRSEEVSSGSMRMLAEEMLAGCRAAVPLCLFVTAPMRTAEEFVQQLHDASLCRMLALPFGTSGVWCMDTDTLKPNAEPLPDAFCTLATRAAQQIHSRVDPALTSLTDYWTSAQPCEATLLRQLEYLLGKLRDGGCDTGALTAAELLADAVCFDDIAAALRPFVQPVSPSQDKGGAGALAQINQIKCYIDDHYDKPLSYRVLYEKFGYHEKYIAYLFKKEIGMTPSKYIASVRIEAAKRLLRTQPGMLQKDVAQRVGFSDPLYFSRVFRDFIGMSPSRFVKSLMTE